MRSVEHGADGANGCVPLAAIASERDTHIGFILRLESGHVPTASQAQKMRRAKGTYRESGVHSSRKSQYHACSCSDRISLSKQSEKRPKYSGTYRYSGTGSDEKSLGIIRIGNEQLRDSSH
ncbi:hypothetical protein DFH09DRAFT_1106585 [Mycena vulgaris]|nr:hypothetical protein DFH09DRAFT_1106585 [Mycena vulgaris]